MSKIFYRPSRNSDLIGAKDLNNIRPVDSKKLTNYLANDLMGGSDLKFVAWDDFDKALESDPILFHKLHNIGKIQNYNDILEFVRGSEDISVVNLNDDYNNKDGLFYRTDRSFDNNFIRILKENSDTFGKEGNP